MGGVVLEGNHSGEGGEGVDANVDGHQGVCEEETWEGGRNLPSVCSAGGQEAGSEKGFYFLVML